MAARLRSDTASTPTIRNRNAVLIDGKVNLRSDSAIAAISHLPGYGWVRGFRVIPKVSARRRLFDDRAQPLRWFGRNETCWLGGAKYSNRVIG